MKQALIFLTTLFVILTLPSPAFSQSYLTDICQQLTGTAVTNCQNCISQDGFWTGLGCISFNPWDFAGDLLRIGISLAGGIALLIMLFGAFTIATASGNPELVQKGQESFTSAIIGLIFIIFSIVILNFFGVEILNIPDF